MPELDRLTLRRDLQALVKLKVLLRKPRTRSRIHYMHGKKKRWQAPRKSKSATPGVCKCGEKTPHSTKDEWRTHWRIPHFRARMWNFPHMKDPTYRKHKEIRVANNYRRAVERRILIFKEMAPQATALMSHDELEKVVTSVRNPTNGALWSYHELRRFIHRTYGDATGGIRKRLTPNA